MIWLEGDRYHIRSKCGRYTVAKNLIDGAARYIAFFLTPKQPSKEIGAGSTAGICKSICETHERNQQQQGSA